MQKSLVSIVIPVYNSEKYLALCIDSVLAQSYDSLECILVDDGSKDESGELCDYYARIDKRVTVLHKNNEGVSAARNDGLSVAKGDYIMFLDSDDTICKDYVERHIAALAPDVDLVISKLYSINEGDPYNVVDDYSSLYHDRTLPWAFPFCKLFKSGVINQNKVRFNTEMRLCEDWMFVMDYIRYTNKISTINFIGYKWNTDNGESLSRGCTFDYRIYAYDVALHHLEEIHKDKGIDAPGFYKAIKKKNMRIAIDRMYNGDPKRNSEDRKERYSRLSLYYSLYGSYLEKKLNAMVIFPIMIDFKKVILRDFIKVLSLAKNSVIRVFAK